MAPAAAGSRSSWRSLGAGAGRSGQTLEAAPPRSWWQLWGSARGTAVWDGQVPQALQTSQSWNGQQTNEMRGGELLRFAGTPAMQRLRARALEPGGPSPSPDPHRPAGRPWGSSLISLSSSVKCE